jgi:hypothetical protein
MKCEEAMELIYDSTTGDLDAASLDALREHIAGCGACAAEARAMQVLWDDLGGRDAEVPSARLRQRFDRMLAAEIAAAGAGANATSAARALVADGRDDFARARARQGRERSVYRAALGMAIAAGLAVALGAGILIGTRSASKRDADDLAEMRDEIRSLRSTVALALLAEPSPSERLNGVAYGRELQNEDRRVADALFTTLLEDPNVNVRLAALDALREASSSQETRARLLESIPAQDSPLVQISAIDILLESVAPSSAPASAAGTPSPEAAARLALSRLAENPELDEVVRGYLRDRLERSPR